MCMGCFVGFWDGCGGELGGFVRIIEGGFRGKAILGRGFWGDCLNFELKKLSMVILALLKIIVRKYLNKPLEG